MDRELSPHLRTAAKARLDAQVVNIELTLISIIQGALNALYAAAVWLLYAWDLRVVRAHVADFATPDERALYDDIVADQRLNIAWMMPAAVAFQAASWWAVHAWPETFIAGRWHLLPIAMTLLFSLHYLLGGVRLLQRRRDWIVSRNAQESMEE